VFGFEFSHILLLAAIALIVLGPKQMPQLARVLGRTMGELRKAIRDVTSQMATDLTAETPKKAPPPEKKDPPA
jgi:Tat protein translocase TatB subunit